VVLTDGLRPDAIRPGLTPHLHALGEDHTRARRAVTIRPSVTVAALASLATGVAPDSHGLVEPGLAFLSRIGRLRPLPQELMRHNLTTTVVAGVVGATARHIARALCSCAGVRRVVTAGRSAGEVALEAAVEVRRAPPGLVFVYLSDCNRAGHASGWMSPEYLEAVREVDAAIGVVVRAAAGAHLMVLADHGGGGVEPRDHDLPHPVNDAIPLILAGPRVLRHYVLPREVSLLDVPPTVLAMLGLPVPAQYEGRALVEAFVEEPCAEAVA